MTGFTDRVSQGILNHITGKTAIFSIPVASIALFTGVGIDDGSGFTEVSGGSYARVATAALDWNTATGTAPSEITNARSLTFPIATANWGNIIAFGLYDAALNLLAWDYFGNFSWIPATVNAASPAVITTKAHGYNDGDLVEWTIEYGGTNPTYSQSSLNGILTATNTQTDSFSVTNASLAVNTSTTGSGMVRKLISQSILTGAQAAFPAGALKITSA